MRRFLAVIMSVLMLCCFSACNETSGNKSGTVNENNSAVSGESTSNQDGSSSENAEGTCEFSNVVMDIPKGFVSLNDSETFKNYVTENYPEELDGISFSKSSETLEDYSEENLNQLMEQLNERAGRNIYSDEGCRDYKQYTIDGHDVVSYNCEITGDDTVSAQKQVVVFVDDGAVIISFSSLSGKYDEDFQTAVDSIRVNS